MNPTALPDYLSSLQKRIHGELRTDEFDLAQYSTDASIHQVMPYGVLIPKSMDDVQAAIELAAKYKVPILPRAAGTSLAGQATNAALVIDSVPHLNKIIEINAEEKWVRVQPGGVLSHLNTALRPHGLQFGPDPASGNRAAMGGVIGNNATGSHSIIYGMSADHVLGTDVILADGSRTTFGFLEQAELQKKAQGSGFEGQLYSQMLGITQIESNQAIIRERTPQHWRRCGGYNADRLIGGAGVSFHIPQDLRFNLAKLICGSEGTLAFMSEVKLGLVEIPKKTAIAVVHFDSLKSTLDAVPSMLETNPSAIELIDHVGLAQCRSTPQYAPLLDGVIVGEPQYVLITEFYGEGESELQAKVAQLEKVLQGWQIVQIFDPKMQSNVWAVRKAALGFLMSVEGDHKPVPFIEDAAVPVEHLGEYVGKMERFCNDLGTEMAYFAHASAGCLHVRPMINTKMAEEVDKLPQIVDFAVDLLRGFGGALSSEHGDGRSRSWVAQRFFGPELHGIYRQIKTAFDPDNIFNPGNIVDGDPITANLRYGGDYKPLVLNLNLDFSATDGFARAIEACNGEGVCRKEGTGTMCPSYMATRDEKHSTRGRANTLRAALSGILPPEALTDKRMYEIMELCVSCKSCQRECPSAVDMAKLKFEFLAQYYKVHPIPLRSRIFASIHLISRIAAGPLAPMTNAVMGSKMMRLLLEKTVGISSKRVIPAFAKQPFTKWFEKHQKDVSDGASAAESGGKSNLKKKIVLFNDTFNTYNNPEVAISATEVFEAAGFEVLLPDHKCCGRPAISKGLVDQARKLARDTVAHLYPFAEQDIPIVGLEPSCLLSMRDEYHYLLPDDPRVQVVSEQCYTFEEFITKIDAEGKWHLPLKTPTSNLILHGHCQQKAISGIESSTHTLNLLPNADVQTLDTGCCGMAGSFGYEAEHYDISMQMGEDRLFPAVRNVDGETLIVAAGTSCRHQIEDGTGKKALHPAEVMRRAMKD